jgi:hypothetical protein
LFQARREIRSTAGWVERSVTQASSVKGDGFRKRVTILRATDRVDSKANNMPTDYVPIAVAARLAHGDLIEIDRRLADARKLDAQWLLLVKLALVSVANVTDLELSVRSIYMEHPDVSAEFKRWKGQFEFAKYIRNVLVGHTNDALINKAIEWKPELLHLISSNDGNSTFLINLAVLETALNTYVDANEKHIIFGGDTDLMYPPDWTRFLIFLTEVVRGAIGFLAALIAAASTHIATAPAGADLMARYVAAGRTTFKRITKGR